FMVRGKTLNMTLGDVAMEHPNASHLSVEMTLNFLSKLPAIMHAIIIFTNIAHFCNSGTLLNFQSSAVKLAFKRTKTHHHIRAEAACWMWATTSSGVYLIVELYLSSALSTHHR
ncbi:hypothetical protein ACJX0J_034634, partial [Zea mays]